MFALQLESLLSSDSSDYVEQPIQLPPL